MPKSLAEKIAWYQSPEDRSWKRRLQFAEIVFFMAMVASCCAGVLISDGPKRLEAAFYLFAGVLFASLAMLGPFFLRDRTVSRYVRAFIILGLGAGGGSLAGFGLLVIAPLEIAS